MLHRDLLTKDQEGQRLEDLYSLDILDTPSEERFDRITRLVRAVFSAPVALVNLLDSDRQWFKSNLGLDASQTPRCIAICDHAIREASHLVVPDLTEGHRLETWRNSLFEQALYKQDGLPGEQLFADRSQQTLTRVENAAVVVVGVNEYALSILELPVEQQGQLDRELAQRIASLFESAEHVATLGNGRYAALVVLADVCHQFSHIQRESGLARVMYYQFRQDGTGEVKTEAKGVEFDAHDGLLMTS